MLRAIARDPKIVGKSPRAVRNKCHDRDKAENAVTNKNVTNPRKIVRPRVNIELDVFENSAVSRNLLFCMGVEIGL
jgi:hypothetical protein